MDLWVRTLSIAKIYWCLEQMIKNNHPKGDGDVNRLKFIFAVKKEEKKKKRWIKPFKF